MKNLEFFISVDNVVLWFFLIVVVCCDFSNLLDVNFFFILVCELVEYISSLCEGELLKVDICVVYGCVLLL